MLFHKEWAERQWTKAFNDDWDYEYFLEFVRAKLITMERYNSHLAYVVNGSNYGCQIKYAIRMIDIILEEGGKNDYSKNTDSSIIPDPGKFRHYVNMRNRKRIPRPDDGGISFWSDAQKLRFDKAWMLLWKILSENGRTTVDGKCSERITWSDNVRNYDLDIHGEMYRGIWSLDISYPARNLHLTAEGSHLDTMGRFSVTRTVPRTQSVVMQIQGTYVHMDDAFNCSLSIMDRINGSWSVSALVGEDILDVKAMDATGRQSMALKLLKAGDTLASGSFRLRSQRNEYALVYDGEKAVISMDGQTVTCTWGTESDQAFVVRLHPEDTVDGTQDDRDMLGRMEYTGQEGDFTVTATLTDAEGGEVIRAELKCQPSDGIHEKIADMENLVHVTPEMILSLLGR